LSYYVSKKKKQNTLTKSKKEKIKIENRDIVINDRERFFSRF
jgi:hypothetical protein